jgi:hypothetical protein
MMQPTRQKEVTGLSMVIGLLLVFGLYFPTSASAHLTAFSVSAYLICLALLSVLILRRHGHPSAPVCIVLLSITPLLLVFTFTSGLSTLRLGALFVYGVLSVLFITNLRDVGLPRWFGLLWVTVNIINIAAGFAIVAGVQPVNDFIIAHYSTAYEELLPNMLALRKPVLTFGSHSVAAFFLYLFFWINLQAGKLKGQKFFMVFSVCYLFLISCLLSTSALVFTTVGLFQLAALVWSSVRHKAVWATAALIVMSSTAAFWVPAINWGASVDVVKEIIQDPDNGLSGRFLPGGTMYYDLQYLQEQAFLPVGTSYREGFMFGDNGPVEYMLRGSVPFLLLIYGGLFYFLRRNLILRPHAYFLFAAILLFELGITTLINLRALFLIPVFSVYLNSLTASRIQYCGRRDVGSFARAPEGPKGE